MDRHETAVGRNAIITCYWSLYFRSYLQGKDGASGTKGDKVGMVLFCAFYNCEKVWQIPNIRSDERRSSVTLDYGHCFVYFVESYDG